MKPFLYSCMTCLSARVSFFIKKKKKGAVASGSTVLKSETDYLYRDLDVNIIR